MDRPISHSILAEARRRLKFLDVTKMSPQQWNQSVALARLIQEERIAQEAAKEQIRQDKVESLKKLLPACPVSDRYYGHGTPPCAEDTFGKGCPSCEFKRQERDKLADANGYGPNSRLGNCD